MSYDMLVAKLRTPRWVPFSNKYYASVAQQLELFIVDRTDEERDNLKGELVRFALYWYADLTDDPRCRANPGEFALLPEFDALPEFVDKVRAAGYDCRISSDWTHLISFEWDHPISG
jgi:hypothetical protein